ncbi:hypothetical protein SAMN04488109_5224 [Chryseolinea serpens]|uniref:Uncharacterized protein n=1 Tax=Chryseolinea serpens TaxID=947013 RepID=A0A1M5VMI3_9BACT|nr:hypothetical protein SAMN04488109_5224 [Chryseolinea serpens]
MIGGLSCVLPVGVRDGFVRLVWRVSAGAAFEPPSFAKASAGKQSCGFH